MKKTKMKNPKQKTDESIAPNYDDTFKVNVVYSSTLTKVLEKIAPKKEAAT